MARRSKKRGKQAQPQRGHPTREAPSRPSPSEPGGASAAADGKGAAASSSNKAAPGESAATAQKLQAKWVLLALLGCWALSFAAYGTSLPGAPVFDDMRQLVRSDCYHGVGRIPSMFRLADGDTACTSRPVRSASFAIDYTLFGRSWVGYHAHNVLLHGVVTLLLGLLVLQLGGSRRLALIAGALFALHPIGTEAVAYMSGRRDLLAALFGLLAARLYLAHVDGGGMLRAVGAPFCLALGILSHELVAGLPAGLALIVLARDRRADPQAPLSLGGAIRALLTPRRAAPLVAMSVVVLAYAAWKIFGVNPSHRDELWGPNVGAHIGTVLRVHVHYLKQLALPINLIGDYSADTFRISQSLAEPTALGACALVFGLIGVCVWSWRLAPLPAALGLSYFALLLPVSQIIIHHELIAEHRLYLPAACFCVLVAVALERGLESWGRPVWGLVGATLVAYLALTNSRNLDWRTPFIFWSKTVEQAPRNARALGNLGAFYLQRGKLAKSRELLERALKIRPGLCAGNANLGDVLVQLGEPERGLALLRNSTCLPYGRYHFRLGRALGRLERHREAAEQYRKAIAKGPPRGVVHFRLANALRLSGDRQGAIEHYRKALAINPGHPAGMLGLGLTLAQQCQQEEARRVLGALKARVKPESKPYRNAAQVLKVMQRVCRGR